MSLLDLYPGCELFADKKIVKVIITYFFLISFNSNSMVPYPRRSLRTPITPPPSITIFAFIKPIPSAYHSVTIFLESEEPSTIDSNFIASKLPALVETNSLLISN